MADSIHFTGGARIGWVAMTWPFGSLTVSEDRLSLNGYAFAPDQVISLVKYVIFPLIGWGIRIVHNRPDYPETMIFGNLRTPGSLLAAIHDVGFRPTADPVTVLQRNGMAFRWQTVVGAVVIWNFLFICDLGFPPEQRQQLGPFSLAALILLFACSVGLQFSKRLQWLFLKPGRHVGEVKSLLQLVSVISGLMIVVFGLVLAGLMRGQG